MANIGPVNLTITIGGGATSTASVRYTVVFTAAEVTGNRRYRETIMLFSQDPPAGPAGDDPLFVFFPPRIVRPNNQAVVQRTLSSQVPNAVLDEDPGPDQDEIYARVFLTPLDPPFAPANPPFRDSNVVSI